MHDFNPTFTKTSSISECADLINRPHVDDYPLRVNATGDALSYYIEHGTNYITEDVCKAIHSHIMWDMDVRNRGLWRRDEAFLQKSNGELILLTAPIMIRGEIEDSRLFPFRFNDIVDESDIIRWYRTFEIIHPFMDGNGRVGGVIAAVASYNFFNDGSMLAPCQ